MRARVFVDIEGVIGDIDPKIYGQFIEHLGRCIYGGIWVGEDAGIANVRGFRKDVLEAVKAIAPPIVRYPGGNFVSGYHWEDGIGPRGERPARFDLAWRVEEPNQFGTDEFIEWCRLVGTEPYICVNAGSGTPEEAARWVEYCNYGGSTCYASLRRRYGHQEPYGIRYWGLGNELYGEWQVGHCVDGKECARRTLEFAKLMRRVDEDIELVGVGHTGEQWNWDMVAGAGKWFQHLAVHIYIRQYSLPELLASSLDIERTLRRAAGTVESARAAAHIEHPIGIAFDEWNVWYPSAQRPEHWQVTSLKDGLFTAATFNTFHRLCNELSMACFAQTVNALPLIHTHPEDGRIYCNPQYLAFRLYVPRTGEKALRARCEVEAYRSETLHLDAVPYLDVSATFSEARRTLFLHAVNRHEREPVEAEIELRGITPKQGKATILTADSADARNDFDHPGAVALAEHEVSCAGRRLVHAFPPLSATVLELVV